MSLLNINKNTRKSRYFEFIYLFLTMLAILEITMTRQLI